MYLKVNKNPPCGWRRYRYRIGCCMGFFIIARPVGYKTKFFDVGYLDNFLFVRLFKNIYIDVRWVPQY